MIASAFDAMTPTLIQLGLLALAAMSSSWTYTLMADSLPLLPSTDLASYPNPESLISAADAEEKAILAAQAHLATLHGELINRLSLSPVHRTNGDGKLETLFVDGGSLRRVVSVPASDPTPNLVPIPEPSPSPAMPPAA